MRGSAQNLLELIEKVLDISKIEAGKIVIINEPFDLYLLIKSIISVQRVMAETKGLLITFHIHADLPPLLEGDRKYIRQVLMNLLNNAIKFTDHGTINLSVYGVSNGDNSTTIRFEIKDTGIGIDKHLLGTVFNDFTRIETETARHTSGSGLGTTISKELVELMNGRIGVESVLKQGSTFWFELPFTIPTNLTVKNNTDYLLIIATEQTIASMQSFLNTLPLSIDFVESPMQALSMLQSRQLRGKPYQTVFVDNLCLQEVTATQFISHLKSKQLFNGLSLALLNPTDKQLSCTSTVHCYPSIIDDLNDEAALLNALNIKKAHTKNSAKVVTLSDYYKNLKGATTLNILIAEDNQVNQMVLSGILKRAGHSVLITSDGEQALDLLVKSFEKIDLLIVDKNMPKYAGDEVVKALRFMDTYNSLPIIMLTADATNEAKALGEQLAIDAFLTKPINAHKLLACIAQISKRIKPKSGKSHSDPIPTELPLAVQQQGESEQWCDMMVLQALSALDSDPEFLTRLIAGFIEDSNQHIIDIQQATSDDYPLLREALHALKGTSSELGANKLSDACKEGEKLKAYDIGTPKVELLVSKISTSYEKTVETLNDYLAKTQPD